MFQYLLFFNIPIILEFMKSVRSICFKMFELIIYSILIPSLHFFFKKNFWLSGVMLFLSLMGMVFVRHAVRLLRLAGQFDPAWWRVAPQWSPFAMFLACFVVMLIVLAWMLRMFFGAGRPQQEGGDVAWGAVKAKIRELIDAEDKKDPLGDDEIVEEMKKQGIDVARRTVAKYRGALGVPPRLRRRQF